MTLPDGFIRTMAPGRAVRRVEVLSLGAYVPPRVLTNADLEKMVDTNDEWILQRTGIRERHIVDPGVATSDLAKEASRIAIERAGIGADEIDLVIVGTSTPDTVFPSTACVLQHKLGIPHAWGYDLMAACSGFTYALSSAAALVASGMHRTALVVGADAMSSIVDYTDRATCVIFGDGAGAMIVRAAEGPGPGIIDFANEIDGAGGPALRMPAGGSAMPASHETVDQRLHFIKQDGQAVFKFAVRRTEEICRRLLAQNNMTGDDVDLFVSHQANRRIIQSAAEKIGLPPEKVIINLERYGNTTAATIPLALADVAADGRLEDGHTVLLTSVGAGFTVGSVLLTWSGNAGW